MKPCDTVTFSTINSSGTCNLTPIILLSLLQNIGYLEAPAILEYIHHTRTLGNHIPEHIQSTAPTDNGRKSYIDFTIGGFF